MQIVHTLCLALPNPAFLVSLLSLWYCWQVGAAVLGVPVKPTIKEVDHTGMVTKTLVRAALWEVQTPQVV